MKSILRGVAIVAGMFLVAGIVAGADEKKDAPMLLNRTMKSLGGKDVDLSAYQGKVVLIVNVASKCGFTPQYKALEALHEKYADKGLAILGFPANDFKNQEPGSAEQIQQFCTANYGVKFDLFEKIHITGDDKNALYKDLITADPQGGGEVKWNFEKFLIGKDGKEIERFRSKTKPDSDEMVKAIEAALAAK